eukprot:854494-Rhodomonas_salina.1
MDGADLRVPNKDYFEKRRDDHSKKDIETGVNFQNRARSLQSKEQLQRRRAELQKLVIARKQSLKDGRMHAL